MPKELPSPTIVECRKCQGSVIANAVVTYAKSDPDDHGETQFGLFQCSQCEAPFLVRRVGGPDQDDRDGAWYMAYGAWTTLHPSAPSLPKEVPEHIRRGYREAAACFGAGSNTATAIMGRRTIEAICLDKGATKNVTVQPDYAA